MQINMKKIIKLKHFKAKIVKYWINIYFGLTEHFFEGNS